MPKSPSLRIGKVTLYQRGNVWYMQHSARNMAACPAEFHAPTTATSCLS
jgi:hypothetical protein